MKSIETDRESISREIRPKIPSWNTAMIGIAWLAILTAIFWLNVAGVVNVAHAGTEDGSFCPTCPDWTNLEGWYSQEQAYSEAELQKILNPSKSGQNASASSNSTPTKSAAEEKATYPVSRIYSDPAAEIRGVILDTRSPDEYRDGHIPGARNLYWESVRPEGTLNSTLLVSALSSLGVNRSDSVIVYGNGDDASYIFWALEYLGHDNVSKIDGGIAAWRAKDRPVVAESSSNTTSNYVPETRTWLLTDLEMLNHSGVQILDSRESFSDFGKSHLKNAILMPGSSLFSEDGTLLEPSALEELFTGRGIDREKIQIIYGMPSAGSLYYVLRLMGYKPTLLDSEWWRRYAVSNIR